MTERINVYYTHPLSGEAQQRLSLLLTAPSSFAPLESQAYESPHYGLSPIRLFQNLGCTFGSNLYAVIDRRTEADLNARAEPTVAVTVAWEITLDYESDLYHGTQDLDSLPESARLEALRALAEERAVRDAEETGEEWVWDPNAEQHSMEEKVWQIKSVRTNLDGMRYICSVYAVKDANDMHKLFQSLADANGGVFRPEFV